MCHLHGTYNFLRSPLPADSFVNAATQPDRLSFEFRHIRVKPRLELRTDFRVEWIRPGRAGKSVAPVFVHPNPGRRILPNEWFDLVPACLGDLYNGGAFFELKLGEKPECDTFHQVTVRSKSARLAHQCVDAARRARK